MCLTTPKSFNHNWAQKCDVQKVVGGYKRNMSSEDSYQLPNNVMEYNLLLLFVHY